MKSQPWRGRPSVREGYNFPAIYVSWEDANEFCRQLSVREGRTYRLPTEAEWEYACRAGSTSRFHYGESEESLARYAWHDDNTLKANEQYAHRVGLKQANSFGLHDMHGNVWEWCSDWYGSEYYASLGAGLAADPRGPGDGSYRVLRGGGWDDTPRYCRSAHRYGNTPDYRYNFLGFRVVSAAPEISTHAARNAPPPAASEPADVVAPAAPLAVEAAPAPALAPFSAADAVRHQ